MIKVKLGRDNDKELIQTIRSVTDVPLYVDANQGWTDLQKSLDLTYWLQEQGVLLIEQPMLKTDHRQQCLAHRAQPDAHYWR